MWEPLGTLSLDGKGAVYKAQSFIDALEGRPYRFIVVHSTALNRCKAKSIEKRIDRESTALQKAAKVLVKERFNCYEDADKALSAFVEEYGGGFHSITGTVHEKPTIKRPPGRPRKDAIYPEIVQWRVAIEIAPPPEERIQQAQDRENSFIPITNLDEPDWSNRDVLHEYKQQGSLENRFRNLKAAPCIVDNIYVKSSHRAEALAYLFLSALIVAAFIEIRIRQELARRGETFMMPGQRLTDRPTMTGLFDVMQTVLIMVVESDDGVHRVLPDNTDPRVREILDLTGFDESVYT